MSLCLFGRAPSNVNHLIKMAYNCKRIVKAIWKQTTSGEPWGTGNLHPHTVEACWYPGAKTLERSHLTDLLLVVLASTDGEK